MKTKKIIYVLMATMLLGFGASAQLEKGNWLFGAAGNVGFNSFSPKVGSGSETTINISPNAGYFVMDHLAVGLDVNFGSQSVSGGGASVTKSNFGPFVRYYFGSSNVFGQVEYGFGSDNSTGSSVSSSVLAISAGYAIWVNSHIAIEPSVYYKSESVASTNVGSDIGLNIGFELYLGGK